MKHISRKELNDWLNQTLQPQSFADYCPNGLQVEGSETVSHIVCGVTASQALLDEAVARSADTVMVHHGWFWKNEDPRIQGIKKKRLAVALQHNLNIFGYHLPLDAHPELGNNAQLARVLGFVPDRDETGNPITCGPGNLVWLGRLATPQTLESVSQSICKQLQRQPLTVGDKQQIIDRVAWCTGGAQGYMQVAVDAGVDLYLSGEASEPTFHLANETETAYVGAGHHATERYGIKALGEAIQQHFGIRVDFVDLDNPI